MNWKLLERDQIETLFFQPEIFPLSRAKETGCKQLNEVTAELYSKLAYRDSTEGVIAIVREKHTSLDKFTLSSNPLIIVLEAVEKPGNLGAVLQPQMQPEPIRNCMQSSDRSF